MLSTPANISITSAIKQATQSVVGASASKPDKTSGSAIAVGNAVGLYTNEADATLDVNTITDAGGSLTVTADVNYPILTDPSQWYIQAFLAVTSSATA